MSSFGETADKNAFFTGKPMIDELGYSFLFRDYNPNQGKWTTTDPLGYPDGWNNLAYCNSKFKKFYTNQNSYWEYNKRLPDPVPADYKGGIYLVPQYSNRGFTSVKPE